MHKKDGPFVRPAALSQICSLNPSAFGKTPVAQRFYFVRRSGSARPGPFILSACKTLADPDLPTPITFVNSRTDEVTPQECVGWRTDYGHRLKALGKRLLFWRTLPFMQPNRSAMSVATIDGPPVPRYRCCRSNSFDSSWLSTVRRSRSAVICFFISDTKSPAPPFMYLPFRIL